MRKGYVTPASMTQNENDSPSCFSAYVRMLKHNIILVVTGLKGVCSATFLVV